MARKTEKPNPPADRKPLPLAADASAAAPFLYFEDATAYSALNGVIKVTLEAIRLVGGAPDGGVAAERVIVANLTMNLPAARSLRSALDKALLLAAPAASTGKAN